jgi:hypothetical protein
VALRQPLRQAHADGVRAGITACTIARILALPDMRPQAQGPLGRPERTTAGEQHYKSIVFQGISPLPVSGANSLKEV